MTKKGLRYSNGDCPTGKRRYTSIGQAVLHLLRIRGRRVEQGSDRAEQHVYPCPKCHGYHLSSKGRKGPIR